MRWRRFIPLLLVGCTHDGPTVPIRSESEMGHRSSVARVTNPKVTGYWRRSLDGPPNTAELWLYQNFPELGFNAHLPGDLRWTGTGPTQIGSTLIRHTVYWHAPLEYSLGQLADAVAAAPDGATMLVNVHSKELCVDHSVPGDREAKYQQYADYVSALAAAAPRSGRVRVLYWQIYNEMNFPGWTNMFGAPAVAGADTICAGDGASEYEQGQRYAELLRVVYPAIKQATHDTAWVVMGALGSIDTSTNVYSATGRYSFFHGMYSMGAGEHYDIAAIQPYGIPGVIGIRRTADFDRALAMYGEEGRPVFMTEFGSKEPPAGQWPDLHQQIESARSTRLYNKIFVFVLCAEGDPYSVRATPGDGNRCEAATTSYEMLRSLRHNNTIYGADSVLRTDVIIPRPRGDVEPAGYDYVDEGDRFRILDIDVHYREPTRVRFRHSRAPPPRLELRYRVYLDGMGWTEWVPDSATAGTAHVDPRRINALQVRAVNAEDVSVVYSVRQRFDWNGTATDGAIAGDTVQAATGIRIGIRYKDGRPGNYSVCYELADASQSAHPAQCDDAEALLPTGALLAGVRAWIRR